MRMKKYWAVILILWTLVLAVWTILCWNSWSAKAAAKRNSEFGVSKGQAPASLAPQSFGGSAAPLDVPFLDQEEEGFPTGCESVSAVMALQYWGVEITIGQFVDDYLAIGNAPYYNDAGDYVGCDPRKAFPGDPRTDGGWGCYAPVIREALEDILKDRPELGLTVKELSGVDLDQLCETYVDKGAPVLVWATIGMAEPYCSDTFLVEDTGETFQWLYPMHCMVLTGREGDSYLFNDPLDRKNTEYSRQAAEIAYEGLGRQAIVLMPQGQE